MGQTLPGWIGSVTAEPLPVLSQGPFGFVPFPLIVCVLGGLVIGLYAKHTGVEPEDLNSVMAKVKQDGRYDYSHIGKLSLAALLPLLFGGSIGAEAGLTGVIAGLCTWLETGCVSSAPHVLQGSYRCRHPGGACCVVYCAALWFCGPAFRDG